MLGFDHGVPVDPLGAEVFDSEFLIEVPELVVCDGEPETLSAELHSILQRIRAPFLQRLRMQQRHSNPGRHGSSLVAPRLDLDDALLEELVDCPFNRGHWNLELAGDFPHGIQGLQPRTDVSEPGNDHALLLQQ